MNSNSTALPVWQEHANEAKYKEDLSDEVEMVRAEHVTLKKLLVAKDSLLIQKNRVLDNIKVRSKQISWGMKSRLDTNCLSTTSFNHFYNKCAA